MGAMPKKDKHEEFEDTTVVIRGRTPKKDRQKEFEDTKGVISTRISKKDRRAQDYFFCILKLVLSVRRCMFCR
jgi:hypothetical protein